MHPGSDYPPPTGEHGSPREQRVPGPGTSLVGREREIAQLLDLVERADIRLVTITGAGGVGKTRVAQAVTQAARQKFRDGAYFVPLADLIDATLVLSAIASALDIREQGQTPAAQSIKQRLIDQDVLLVLDNLEHLPGAFGDLASLLANCPRLTILATSRVLLNISGEYEIPLPVLTLPSAVQLFVDRAKATNASYALSAANASKIAAICNRLEGLPLAIELAAARTSVLNPDALLGRLEQPLPLLIGGPEDQPDRLRTLRSAIAWSYELLDKPEQVMFCRFAVFAGGFRLETVRDICFRLTAYAGATGEEEHSSSSIARLVADPVALPDRLDTLVASSLLRFDPGREPGEQPRYRMLETIRAFGAEQLDASSEGPMVRAAHAASFLALAERLSDEIAGEDYERALRILDSDLDNIRTAFSWAWTIPDPDLAIQLAEAMGRYAAVRGRYREGRHWLERSLAIGQATPTTARTRALRAAGWLARLQGDTVAALALQTNAIDISREIGDRAGQAAALQELALVHMHRTEYDQALTRMEEALALNRTQEGADPHGAELVSVSCANLAQIALAAGRPEYAKPLADEALRRQRDLGYGWALGDTLRIAGDIASVLGDHDHARAAYLESIELTQDHGDRRFLSNALAGLANECASAGQPACAARLYAAVAVMRSRIGAGLEQWQVDRDQQGIDRIRVTLTPGEFDDAWSAGAEMAISDLLAGVQATLPTNPASPAFNDLTPREMDVLRLLVSGSSDREISEQLSISPRTVGGHVSAILSKLHVESRTAAVAFALRNNLG